MYSLGLILHLMMAKDLPNYTDNVKTGIFKIPEHYSKNIVDLMSSLLKKKPEMRPNVKEILQNDYLLMYIEKLENVNCKC